MSLTSIAVVIPRPGAQIWEQLPRGCGIVASPFEQWGRHRRRSSAKSPSLGVIGGELAVHFSDHLSTQDWRRVWADKVRHAVDRHMGEDSPDLRLQADEVFVVGWWEVEPEIRGVRVVNHRDELEQWLQVRDVMSQSRSSDAAAY